MLFKLLQVLAVVLTALALVPGGAHLLALPGKINMTVEQYFTVQQIYAGWALLGVVLFAALLANAVLAVMLRAEGLPFWLAVAGAFGIALTLVLFVIWVHPANVATDNWTQVPENWQALRTNWEYGHAANAVITLLSLVAVTAAVVLTRR
jgi:hypothetical protein